ncbi:MAG: protein-disulfide isomerase, partial [Mycobacterium sp.]
MLAALTLLSGVGCARQVTGNAQPDPVKPMTEVSKDGFGIVAGFPDAPARIEIYTEPQCTHCADLQ